MKNNQEYIWRIETGDGRGAYRGGLCYGNNETAYSSNYHPGPHEDGINLSGTKNRQCNLFGFQSVHHARRWFSSIHDLRKWEESHDAKLVVYQRSDCKDLQEGKFQMVFTPNKDAKKVSFTASHLHEKTIKELHANAKEIYDETL